MTPEATYRISRYPTALIDRLHLRGDRAVTIRPVLPQDAAAQARFVAALSPTTRYRRFLAGVRELPAAMLARLTQVDYRDHLAIVAEPAAPDDAEPGIVADARYVLDGDDRRAEFALVVADGWQGLGLGGALLDRLIAAARRRGLRLLHGDVLVDNAPMAGLVTSRGGRISPHPEDAVLLRATFAL